MARRKKSNISKFRRRMPANIGLVLFLGAFIYMAVSLYNYLSANHVSEYEVSQGAIAANNTYRGLVLRDETVVYTDKAGYLNYYINNGSKASATDVICSIDTVGDISSKINQAASSSENLDQEELETIVSDIESFTNGFDNMTFSSAYAFQASLSSELKQSLSTNALLSLSSNVAEAESKNTFFSIRTDKPGIVAFYVDGMESVKTDTFTADDLISTGYQRENLDSRTEVQKADPLYKIINSENWNMIIAITAETAEKMNNMSYVDVRFVKDDYSTTASVSIIKKDGKFYVNLGFLRGMIRYLSDRYVEIELNLGDTSGLKIPVSAITTMDFYSIPKTCFQEKSSPTLLVKDSLGKISEITPNISYADDQYYYLDDEYVSEGTVIQMVDTQDTYTVGETKTLTGVYNTNKGYASFRYIKILNESSEYAIVEAKVKYSISLYDHIALDGSKVTQNQTVRK